MKQSTNRKQVQPVSSEPQHISVFLLEVMNRLIAEEQRKRRKK